MATFTFTISAPAAPSVPVPIDQVDRFFGRDLFFDGDMAVTPAGDWLTVEGREALRQAIRRRIVTNPGEWQTLPDYGVGARLFVKAKNTAAARDELVQRISGQLAAEQRIAQILEVILDTDSIPDGLKISVKVQPTGETQRNRPVIVTVEAQ